MKNLIVSVLALILSGCATYGQPDQVLMARGDLMGQLMGVNRPGPLPVKIPPRPPVFPGFAALDHPAPFMDSAYTMRIWNRVRVRGFENRTVLTKVWVAGVPTPIVDNVFMVPWLNYNRAVAVETPACQLTSGDGECWITVQAEVWSVRRDILGNSIPSQKMYCVRSMARAMTQDVYLQSFERAECPATDVMLTSNDKR